MLGHDSCVPPPHAGRFCFFCVRAGVDFFCPFGEEKETKSGVMSRDSSFVTPTRAGTHE